MTDVRITKDADGRLRLFGWINLAAPEKARRIEVARALWPTKMARKQIALESGVPFNALMRALQPGYAERELARSRKRDAQFRRERPASSRTKGDGTPALLAEPRPRDVDVAARLAEIPEDTRTPAQRLMGEPIPERSALFRKRAEAAA